MLMTDGNTEAARTFGRFTITYDEKDQAKLTGLFNEFNVKNIKEPDQKKSLLALGLPKKEVRIELENARQVEELLRAGFLPRPTYS